MDFSLIDLENWGRREYYLHFINEVRCTYSTCVNIDITNIKEYKLYPTTLWLLTQAVNQIPEFRTAFTDKGLGIYDQMHPAYTIFNKEGKNFSGIWTEYSEDYQTFLRAYEADTEMYANATSYLPKPDRPGNTFDVSMIPWFSFTSFDINVFGEGTYLLPIFTLGKFFEANGRRMLPLAIQVHHAVCDGYHVGQFVAMLQSEIDFFAE